ncbi:MAG: MDR family MFS transporter [Lactobacillus sp.]|nr:MDR family MFS transporter [Lactobacillus sp.]
MKEQKIHRGLILTVLVIGGFITILSSTMLATAYPSIMKTFNVDTSTVQWLSTGFIMANGIMIPISAFLINRFPNRHMYMSALLFFLVGTLMCYFAPNFQILLAGRIVAAIGAGITMPIMQTIILTIFPPEKRGVAMGTVGIAIGVAPAIGPTLSGFLVDHLTWRDVFGVEIPLTIIVLLLSFFFMKNVLEVSHDKFDVLSGVLAVFGFGIILYGFAEVGSKGWGNSTVISCIVVGAIIIGLFAYRQFKMEHPFLELRVFKTWRFTLTTIIASLSYTAMISAEMVLPMYIQNILGNSAFQSGLILLPGALGMMIMSPISGQLFDRFGARYLAICGSLFLIIGTVPFLYISPTTPTLYITLFYAVRVFGIAMMMMTLTTYGMNALPVKLMAHGTAVNNTSRQVLGSIGTAIITSILSNVAKNSAPAKSLLHSQPLLYKDQMINSVISGYKVAFLVAVIVAVVVLLLSLLVPKKEAK